MISNVTQINGAPSTDSKSSDLEKLKAVSKQFEAVWQWVQTLKATKPTP